MYSRSATTSDSSLSLTLVDLLLSFLVAIIVVGGVVALKGGKQAANDELAYMSIANDLNLTNTFSDGIFRTEHSTVVPPGRFFAPLYPLLIHAVSLYSPATSSTVSCFADQPALPTKTCEVNATPLMIVQVALAGISATGVFAAAFFMAGSRLIAAVSLVLVLATGELQLYARSYLTENTALPAFFVFLAFGACAALRPSLRVVAGAGVTLALAALSRPSYLYLAYALVPCLMIAAVLPVGRNRGWRAAHLVAYVAAAILVLGPWSARNIALFGDPQISSGYGGYILAQRLAFNAMTWREWLASFFVCLPDHGWGIAEKLFGPDSVVRMGWGPTGFYSVGNGSYVAETVAAAGGREQQQEYLIHHELLGNLFKHMMVTVPLTERGLWVGKYFGLAGFLLIMPVALDLTKHKRLLPFMFVLVPLGVMAVFHGFVSIGVTRYNVPLLTIYCFTVSYALLTLAWRFGVPQLREASSL